MKKIFLSGGSNQQLAKKICQKANGFWGKIEISRFSDGEINIFIQEKLKERDVFIVQSTSLPAQENIIELILISDAARRMEAKSINLIIPYFGYARKERMSRNGEPISAKVIANLIETTKPNRVITVDLHSPVVQGFFETPLINLSPNQILIEEIKKLNLKNLVVVSPDIGGAKRARSFGEALKCPVAIIEKKRFIDQQDKSEVLTIIGNVSGKNIVIVDDLISTGSTIFKAIELLKKLNLKNLTVVSPDIGGAKRARSFGEALKCPVAIIEKKRFIDQQDKSEVLTIIGNVSGKNIVIVDDLISTGSTIFKAIELLKKEGGRKIYVAVSHVAMGDLLDQKLIGSNIEKVLTTDSIAFATPTKSKKIEVVSLDKLIAEELI